MREMLYVIIGLILISISSIYLFIPEIIVASKIERVESSERIISQYINEPSNRSKWWINTPNTVTTFSADGIQYDFIEASYNSSTVLISGKGLKYNSKITWTPFANNIIEIRWRTSQKASLNPVRRVRQYIAAHEVKSNMASILERLLSFAVNTRNVYNLKIERQVVRDTLLATTTFKSTEYPDSHQIYQHIDSIRSYVRKQDVKHTNAPMLNVSLDSDGFYRTTIALPINKQIKQNQRVLLNRMVPGNILVAQVNGGPGMIKNAFNQIKVYMDDFKLSSPAIPFESLITDRRIETDTSKWVTTIYYPVY